MTSTYVCSIIVIVSTVYLASTNREYLESVCLSAFASVCK